MSAQSVLVAGSQKLKTVIQTYLNKQNRKSKNPPLLTPRQKVDATFALLFVAVNSGSIGVSENFLGKVERGSDSVHWGKLFQILEGLGVQVTVDVPDGVAPTSSRRPPPKSSHERAIITRPDQSD